MTNTALTKTGLVAGGAQSLNNLIDKINRVFSPSNFTTAGNALEMRITSSHTSGDVRNHYLQHTFNGAGGSGETLRLRSSLAAAVDTARATQASLEVGASGYATGLGVGVDSQLYVKNEALHSGGTYSVLNAEIYSEGSSSSVAAATEVSFLRFANSGDATGAGTVDTKAFLFDLTGFTSGNSSLWYDHQGSAPANIEEWIKVKTPAGTRYLPLYNAVV